MRCVVRKALTALRSEASGLAVDFHAQVHKGRVGIGDSFGVGANLLDEIVGIEVREVSCELTEKEKMSTDKAVIGHGLDEEAPAPCLFVFGLDSPSVVARLPEDPPVVSRLQELFHLNTGLHG